MKTQHMKRYKEIAKLLWKYGRSDALSKLAELELDSSPEPVSTDEPGKTDPGPEELAADLEAMGPTFVKIGQLLASRSDLLPEPYLVALAKLQDDVKPFSFSEVEEIVQAELGVRLSKAFSSFEIDPAAAASLGQVHRAVLRDGRPVVVKVQRPGIRKQIVEDLEILHEAAVFLEKHSKIGHRHRLVRVVEDFQHTLLQELDYQREASNLKLLAASLREFAKIRVPLPIDSYTARSVLTMDFVSGQKITTLSPVARLDFNGGELADELFRAYLKQVLVDGLFHADPHPGNVFLTDDHCIALIDLGMVGRVSPARQDQLVKLLFAVSEGRSDDASTIAIDMSETNTEFNEGEFRQRIATIVIEQREHTLQNLDLGRTLLEVGRHAGDTGLYVPSELVLLGKTLLQLHQIGRELDPAFDPNSAIRRHLSDILNRRWRKELTPGNVLSLLAEVKEFARTLPLKLSKVLDTLTRPEIEVKVRPEDTRQLLEGLEKIANRIAAGLILAALIVGAALLMQVRTTFQIMGYPGFAILCFVVAAGGGFWLLINIFLHDRRSRRKTPH